MLRSHWLVLFALACTALLAGCNEATTFNNEIVDVTQELESAGRQFGEQLNRHAGNRAKIQELHGECMRKVNDIIARARQIKVPKLKKAKELFYAFRHFLTEEERMVRIDFAGIGYDIGRGDRQHAYNSVMRLQTVETAAIERLQAAQVEFAKANNSRVEFPTR
jgi:hypothetical protein